MGRSALHAYLSSLALRTTYLLSNHVACFLYSPTYNCVYILGCHGGKKHASIATPTHVSVHTHHTHNTWNSQILVENFSIGVPLHLDDSRVDSNYELLKWGSFVWWLGNSKEYIKPYRLIMLTQKDLRRRGIAEWKGKFKSLDTKLRPFRVTQMYHANINRLLQAHKLQVTSINS